jgi:hypothetical protein
MELTPCACIILDLCAGILAGIVPLIIGLKRDKLLLGMGGFLVSALSAAILGFLPALPIAAIFTWVAVRRPHVAPVLG